METTRLSSKGQIIIPKSLRDSHHWRPGTEFIIEDTATGIILRPRGLFPATKLEDGIGCTGYNGPPKTVEEMEEGMLADLRKKWQEDRKS